MSSNISLSIIIPTYNNGKYLKKCITSILPQLSQKDKIIIINDASTDNTTKIISNISNDQIKAINNTINMGVSRSRNVGIKNSTNKYLLFIDGDDYIENGYLEYIRNTINEQQQPDLIINNFNYVDMDNQKHKKTNLRLITNNASDNQILSLDNQELLFSCANKVFNKKIIEDYNILFNPQSDIFEDYEFNLKYLLRSKRVFIDTTASYYNYLYHGNNSASTKYNQKLYTRYKEIKSLRHTFYQNSSIDNKNNIDIIDWNILILCINNLYKPKSNLFGKERINNLKIILSSEDFRKWQKTNKPRTITAKIIRIATISKNAFISDKILSMLHAIKNKSTIITKIFRKKNRKDISYEKY